MCSQKPYTETPRVKITARNNGSKADPGIRILYKKLDLLSPIYSEEDWTESDSDVRFEILSNTNYIISLISNLSELGYTYPGTESTSALSEYFSKHPDPLMDKAFFAEKANVICRAIACLPNVQETAFYNEDSVRELYSHLLTLEIRTYGLGEARQTVDLSPLVALKTAIEKKNNFWER